MKDKPPFKSIKQLEELIEAYFTTLQEINPDSKSNKSHDPPTLSGIAFHLGFESRKAFEEYEQNDKYGPILKRCRLRIEAEYEKQLHKQPSSGAIFALKNMGWNEKNDNNSFERLLCSNIKIEIVQSGPLPAASETEVNLDD